MYKKCFSLVALLLPLLVGCGEGRVGKAGIILEIRDSVTSAPAAYDATVVARDGSYADTVIGRDIIYSGFKDEDATLWVADNRTGTYVVTITHPLYQTWRREGVRVRSSGANIPFLPKPLPETLYLLAQLQPLAPD
jgi:hypothetical protein